MYTETRLFRDRVVAKTGTDLFITGMADELFHQQDVGLAGPSFDALVGLVSALLLDLRGIYTSSKRQSNKAAMTHELFNQMMARLGLAGGIKKTATCRNRCAHCCHIRVDCLPGEAELMLRQTPGIIDTARVDRQAIITTASDWTARLTREQQRCCFLGQDDSCRAYQDRPMRCRTHWVESDPSLCDTRQINKTRLIKILEVELFYCAVATVTGVRGQLPSLALEVQRCIDSMAKQKKGS